MIQVEVFWTVTLCNVAVGYERFGGPHFISLHPEELKQQGVTIQNTPT